MPMLILGHAQNAAKRQIMSVQVNIGLTRRTRKPSFWLTIRTLLTKKNANTSKKALANAHLEISASTGTKIKVNIKFMIPNDHN